MINVNFDDLTISNDFVFGKVMQNKKICKQMLEIILNIKIKEINYQEQQKTIDITSDGKGIRLDVYVEDDKTSVYDIEIQTTNNSNLPKRSRYYQGLIDLNLIEKGDNYTKLNKSYIIFICTFDPFKKGRYIYTFENMCREEPNLLLGDESTKIFLNTYGKKDDVLITKDLKAFLDYIAENRIENSFIEELDAEVDKVKSHKEWRNEYMTLLMRDQENIEKGKEEVQREIITKLFKKGKTPLEISELLDYPLETILKIQQNASDI